MKYITKFYFLCFLILNPVIHCSFQTNIFARLNKDSIGKNLIISPLSIYQVLSLTTNGAKSETLEEMLEVLESKKISELNNINYDILDISKNFETVEMANAVMTKFTPLESFIEISEKYLAPIEPLESVEQVNNWCDEKTHGKIKEIIKKLDDNTVMLLLNAIYFKGEWSKKFLTKDTSKKIFYNFNDTEKQIEVDTMSQLEMFLYYENKNVQVIELSYLKDSMSALIILPKENIDINEYIQEFNKNNEIKEIIEGLDFASVHLELPKFEVDFSSSLKDVLKKLGMKTAFGGEADFSGMRKKGGLFIDDVIHKTYLKVTEQGTEAAAITLVAMDECYIDPELAKQMKVNRPFIFILRNKDFPEGNDLMFISKIEEIK